MAGEHYIPQGSDSESSSFEVSEDESEVCSQSSQSVNTNDKKLKKSKRVKKNKPKFSPEENAEVIKWLESRYKDLYGRGGSSSVSADKDEVWDEFATDLNAIHDGQFKRTPKDIFKRIDNMKKNG